MKNIVVNTPQLSITAQGRTAFAYNYKIVAQILPSNEGTCITIVTKPSFGVDAMGQLKGIAPELLAIFAAEQTRQYIWDAFTSAQDFTCSQRYAYYDSGVAFAETENRFCFASLPNGVLALHNVSASDVLDSQVLENIRAVSRTLSVGLGSLLGSHSAGMGGIASTGTTDSVDLVVLKVSIRDTKSPVHTITFLQSDQFTDRSSPIYQYARQQADHWNALLQQKKGLVSEQQTLLSPLSIADELRKLADLKDSGVISPDEFAGMKVKLLSKV